MHPQVTDYNVTTMGLNPSWNNSMWLIHLARSNHHLQDSVNANGDLPFSRSLIGNCLISSRIQIIVCRMHICCGEIIFLDWLMGNRPFSTGKALAFRGALLHRRPGWLPAIALVQKLGIGFWWGDNLGYSIFFSQNPVKIITNPFPRSY
jgi:hypothetical protein